MTGKFEEYVRYGKLYAAGKKKVEEMILGGATPPSGTLFDKLYGEVLAMFNDKDSFEKIMHQQTEFARLRNDVYGVLGADDIETLCTGEYPMISPFLNYKVSNLESGNKAISYGLSGAGYDIRCKALYRSVKHQDYPEIDPKNPESSVHVPLDVFCDESGVWVPLMPHGAYKGVSYEYFQMPSDIIGLCVGKSTLARVDTVQHITPIEPGWNGYLTMEIVNVSDYPVRFYLNEGVCQVLFLPVSCHTAYTGYYQNQDEQKPYKATENPNEQD